MIRFDRVTKRYPNGREALSELSFELAPGEMAFLTGRSGAGKSSVVNLLLRFWPLEEGTATVGETPIESSPMILRVSFTIFHSSSE